MFEYRDSPPIVLRPERATSKSTTQRLASQIPPRFCSNTSSMGTIQTGKTLEHDAKPSTRISHLVTTRFTSKHATTAVYGMNKELSYSLISRLLGIRPFGFASSPQL